MCGLVAWFDSQGRVDRAALVRARETLAHRGPDAAGLSVSPDGCAGLAFRRLSIIDRSDAAMQPMADAEGRASVVFNGEIYNYRELRRMLEAGGAPFRTSSDTEVLLQAYLRWGEGCLDRLQGMFAFVVWDTRQRRVLAARDRLGIKPLYYRAEAGGQLAFASQLDALLELPGARRALDARALRHFLARGFVDAPRSIFADTRALPPGHVLAWSLGAAAPQLRRYWDPASFAPAADEAGIAEADAVDALEAALLDAVSSQLVADVPLGAFLSGGIDSSVVVAMMRRAAGADVQTYTIGFEDPRFDEAAHAAALARHLGVRHAVLRATERDAREVIPLLATTYDEPFADASQIPTYLLSRLTRGHVTVALSGDGGDELFGGYEVYRHVSRVAPLLRTPVPWRQGVRDLLAPVAAAGGLSRWETALHAFAAPDASALSSLIVNTWKPHEIDVLAPGLGAHASPPAPPTAGSSRAVSDQLALADLQSYLPGDILTKVDRASMAHSLEVRVPLLDHRLVEMALRLPASMKLREGRGKHLLRQVLYRHVPRALVDRPKRGFSVPLDSWLRGTLSGLLDEALAPARLEAEGLFRPEVVRDHLERFRRGREGHRRIWALVMLQMWAARRGLAGQRWDLA